MSLFPLPRTTRLSWLPLLVAACAVYGCSIEFSGRSKKRASETNAPPGLPPGLAPVPGSEPEPPAPATRVARLTHAQWHNSVRELLRLDPGGELTAKLRSDPAQNGFIFDDNVASLEVDEALWNGYRRAAEQAAELVTSNPILLGRLLPPGPEDPNLLAQTFIQQFGMRAYRRPLTALEVDRHLQLFYAAAPLYPGLASFEAGIRLLIETFLQSPHFLYRVESSTQQAGGLIPLSSYEVASRLSYLLWNSMPDDALLAAAGRDELVHPDRLAFEAQRLLADPHAADAIDAFHEQLLEIDRVIHAHPSRALFPDVTDRLAADAARENQLFVRDAVLAQGADLRSLLTSPATFVNAELARIYGVPGNFGNDFVPVTLNAAERSGVLTQIAFLAGNATSVDPDPIHRGVFIARRIACLPIAAPPADIPPLPDPMGRTNRETVQSHTEQPGSVCSGCHTPLINPFGFPFEHYDAVGSYRSHDRGLPVDASAAPLIGGVQVAVTSAVELTQALAKSPEVHECYVRHWLQFAYGRPDTHSDQALIKRLTEASLAGTPVRELLLGLIQTPAFLARSSEELP